MSGGEPSSIKQFTRCAAGQPALSSGYEDRVGVTLDFKVYGLILQPALYFLRRRCEADAPRFVQKMASADV